VLTLIIGIVEAFEIPARQSLIADLVDKRDLQDAIALNSGGFNLARILGPSVAALVIAQLGIAWCFGINALSYLAVLGGLALIRLPSSAHYERPHASPLHGMMEALRWIRADRTTSILMGVVAAFSLLGVPVLTMLPVMAREHLHLDAAGYSALMMCFGAGALLGALVIAAHGARVPRGAVLTISSLALSAAIVAFAVSRSEVFSGAMMFVAGVGMITNNALINGLLQSRVPDRLRGRVLALYVTVYVGMNPLGSSIAGWLARETSAAWAVGGMGAIMFAVAAWVFRRYPELRGA
jgi:predicted MFS family arabinose efflux permease